ncbi:sugar ABC transporter ATP-binding protein [Rhizobium sp. 18055]|uniref:sugar ABC transporter ATP-binding protein n=1 Tax=Rhizobium sp. 18055 TaxID=2681403 RepID=UPI00135B4120|nr:sugar ABC transporter ATP-binding protein [Rhizobium sp. 18055]
MSGQARSPVCALRSVGKQFGPVVACEGISIELFAGEAVALAGENGAGKSTTAKCLYGYYSPTAGHIEVDGQEATLRSPRDGEAAGIVVIPQELDLFPELSIVENMFMGQERPRTKIGTFDWGRMKKTAQDILARLGLRLDVSLPVKLLSAANCKLVEIARALNRNARVIIMDEPTAALTDREVRRLLSIVCDLKAQGVAVVYISHRLDEIFEVCDRIVVLRDGKTVGDKPTSEFTESSLVKMMVGRPLESLFTHSPHPTGAVALEVKSLTSSPSFRDVSFQLRRGEILGISGLIGAGRSELAHALFGLRPYSGQILVDGTETKVRSVSDAFANGIAYLPEERRSQGLILPFSIQENISLASLGRFTRFGLVSDKKESDFAHKAANDFTVVGAGIDAAVSVLSGGNQQKVLIAKTLARNPRIIILDEPTRGVDVGAKSEIYKIIDDLARQGCAVLLISSELNEVLAMSDRILVMREGVAVQTFERNEFSPEAIGAAAAGQKVVSDVA